MFYDELRKRLNPDNTDTIAKEIKLDNKTFHKKLRTESFTIDEVFAIIRAIRSLSMINYIMGEMHPPWKEKNSSTLN
jgi:hypothetical protein